MKQIESRIRAFEENFRPGSMAPAETAQLKRWWDFHLKYAEYFDMGGGKNLKQAEMEALDLDSLPGRKLSSFNGFMRKRNCK